MRLRFLNLNCNAMPRWQTAGALAGMLAVAAALSACSGSNTYAPPPPAAVDVAQPVQQDVTRYLVLSGATQAVSSVNLVARVAGTLQSIDYKDGAPVKKGEQLFLIDPAAYKAQLAQAQASVDQANATLENAQAEYDRQQKLGSQDVASKSTVDSAKAARDGAQAQVAAAEANLQIAQLNLGYTSVTAPFDGIATAHQADVGALVGNGTPTVLATLVQLDPIDVNVNVSENDVLNIRQDLKQRGMTVQALGPIPVEVGTSIEAGYPHQGTVDYIAPQVDPQTGTLALRAAVKNDDISLLPGLFVRMRIATSTDKNALLVPAAAIGTDQQGSYVMIVDDKNVARQTPVQTSVGPTGFQVVDKGLKDSDWVVVGGLDRAVPDATVAPKQTKLTPPPAPATPAH
jgi:membrane fusion protein, multidrug efflux system